MPPTLVFPRKKVNQEISEGAPFGTTVEFHSSGYVQSDIFYRWFQNFIEFSQPNPDKKVLLLLDQHSTHTQNLPVLESALENNIIILAFPPHTSHKLQPVDVSFNKPLSTNFGKHHNKWMRQNKGKVVTLKSFFSIFTPAYNEAATPENAKSGFKRAGIWPFNRTAYTDKDFTSDVELHLKEPLDKEFSDAVKEILNPESEQVNIVSDASQGIVDLVEELTSTPSGHEASEPRVAQNLPSTVACEEILEIPVEDDFIPNTNGSEIEYETTLDEGVIAEGDYELPVIEFVDLPSNSSEIPVSSISSTTNNESSNQSLVPLLSDSPIPLSLQPNDNNVDSYAPKKLALSVAKENFAVVAPKTRKSLKSKAKVVNSEENVKNLKESKKISNDKKSTNAGRRRKSAVNDTTNKQLTAVNLNLNAPTIHPYFYPPMNSPYPAWSPYNFFPTGSLPISAIPTNGSISQPNLQISFANTNNITPLNLSNFNPNLQTNNFAAYASADSQNVSGKNP